MEGLTYFNPTATPTIHLKDNSTLENHHWSNYVLFCSSLLLPVIISSAYGFFGNNEKSSEDFLMGNRQMSTIPVALSLFCSVTSSVTFLGYPVEIYLYGTQFVLILVVLLPVAVAMIHLYLPVYFNMELTSPFEYFERRFTRTTRIFVSSISLAQIMIYTTFVVYFTSTVLATVIGVNSIILSSIFFVISVFSCYAGGYKGVILTNTLQVIVFAGSLLTVVVMGFLSISSQFTLQWNQVLAGNRIELMNFDPDPRVRHTVWTSSIGGYFIWISFYAASHSQIQRFISLPSLRDAKRAACFNIFLLFLVIVLSSILGLLIFTKYFGCDPVKVGSIKNYYMLLPHYVQNEFKDVIGLYGFFVAGITCGGLSATLACLNSMSSLLTFDYFKHWIPNISEESLAFLSKIVTVFLGGLSFVFVIVAHDISPFLPTVWRILGMSFGPTLGMFSLGMFFPWANSKGSLLGMLSALVLLSYNITLSGISENGDDGHRLLLPKQRLPLIISESCLEDNFDKLYNRSYLSNMTFNDNLQELILPTKNPWIPTTHSMTTPSRLNTTIYEDMVSMSYMWYPALGCGLTVFLGLFFSLFFLKFEKKLTVSPECFSPPILKFWLRCFPSHMYLWIEPDENLMLLASSVFSLLPKSTERMKRKLGPNTNCIEITPAYKITEQVLQNFIPIT